MIVHAIEVGDRTARVFVRDGAPWSEAVAAAMRATYEDDDDVRRAPLLRRELSRPLVHLEAHPGVDPADALHLFIRCDERPLFACVVVTELRVARMLEATDAVSETFSLQVALGNTVTPAGTIAAFERWVERNFSSLRVPVIVFSEWSDQPDDLDALLEEAVLEADDTAPAEADPRALEVQHPLDEAA